jgi:uncharacterized protein YbbK (DUF523 family)/uncharacterized protein YbgA (DUF1722 family)
MTPRNSPPWYSHNPIRVGISSCLLGRQVRYDGGHKHNGWLTEDLGRYVSWVPVCPEVELGLPVPRDTLRLEHSDRGLRMIVQQTSRDLTDSMQSFARARVADLSELGLCGYIFKAGSPSCGVFSVNIYGSSGRRRAPAKGLFAQQVVDRNPFLPVEEEGRLADARVRDAFVERLFAYRQLEDLFEDGCRPRELVRFHTSHKLSLLARSQSSYRALGRLVSEAGVRSKADNESDYRRLFCSTMARVPTVEGHTNVLHHVAGFLKGGLEPVSRLELLSLIDDYRTHDVPLSAPLTLVRHLARRLGIDYLLGQTYLEPAPRELMLHY